ncbi:MAG: ABC transporter permease [Candidatus Nanosyncoccaceae bacterium]|jgi:putative ABC transport system permease protein
MFKNMLKRSWLSTIRKPSRSAILILLLLVMANLMLATTTIKRAVDESIIYAKETLSGTVYLQANMETFRQKMESGDLSERLTRPEAKLADARKIATSQYVKDFTFSYQTSANASGFELVENEDSEMMGRFNQMRDRMRQMPFPSGDDIPDAVRGDTQVQGVNAFAFVGEVQSDTMTLVDGVALDENSTGAMISVDLSSQNSLKVGDNISLIRLSDEAELVLPIIGTYETTSENFNANTIYTSVDIAAELAGLSKEDIEAENFTIQNVRYYLTNAEYKDQFITEANAQYPNLEADGLKLDINDSAYQQMVGPIESVGSFAKTIFWVVAVASVLVINLIVTINIKDRRYEMGVLLSLGARKTNIVGQILTELILVSTVALVISFGTGNLIAQKMGNSLLEQQLVMNQQQQNQGFGRGINAGRPGMPGEFPGGGFGGRMLGEASGVKTIDEINIQVGAEDYAVLILATYAVIILAMILPTANILRYQPKEILSSKE